MKKCRASYEAVFGIEILFEENVKLVLMAENVKLSTETNVRIPAS